MSTMDDGGGRRGSGHRVLAVVIGASLGSFAAAGHGEPIGSNRPPPSVRGQYRVDATKSHFVIEIETSPPLSRMFSHDHKVEVADFSGAAVFSPATMATASLDLTVQAASLHLVEEKNLGDREVIEKVMRDEVLETAKFPEISFKSRSATSIRRDDGSYDVRLIGELRLHGVRRPTTVPARIFMQSGALHAIGAFDLRQTDFAIMRFPFLNGAAVIKDIVTISFDIVATPPL
jgi:polyisoprenoid-binding protein YceI